MAIATVFFSMSWPGLQAQVLLLGDSLACWGVRCSVLLRLAAWAQPGLQRRSNPGGGGNAAQALSPAPTLGEYPPSASLVDTGLPSHAGACSAVLEHRPLQAAPCSRCMGSADHCCPPVRPPLQPAPQLSRRLFLCFSEVESSLGSCTHPDHIRPLQALSKLPLSSGKSSGWMPG